MNQSRRHVLVSSAAALTLPSSAVTSAFAQAQPSLRRTIFGFTLGSSAAPLYAETIQSMRQRNAALAGRFAPKLTQHSGASGSRAIELVAKAEPDGLTLLLAPTSTLTLLPAVKRMKARPLTDLKPIVPLAEFTLAFCVGKGAPASITDMPSYLAWVRENADKENYGVPAIGSSTHLLGEQMAATSGVRLRASGYTGTAPLLDDLVSGNIAAGFVVLGSALRSAANGAIRILAVASAQRWPGLSHVPTLYEQGAVRFPYVETFGLFAPAGTPDELVSTLSNAINDTMQAPPLPAYLAAAGFKPMPLTPERFSAELQAEQTMWAEQLKLMKFTVE
jgi:tripartite-type tricarboxylate transporter receptor subunit TctC